MISKFKKFNEFNYINESYLLLTAAIFGVYYVLGEFISGNPQSMYKI